jgi:hypothetical protein
MFKKMALIFFMVGMAVMMMRMGSHAGYYSQKMILREGMQSKEVKSLQTDLQRLGYFKVSPTGYFGIITKSSVVRYQKDKALYPDGVVGPLTSRVLKLNTVMQSSKYYFGVPYVWGGSTPSGFDCSGFTQYVFGKNGIALPRTSSLQSTVGLWVAKKNLKEGDLVVFTTYKPGPSHVGIYAGAGKFIHASSTAGRIIESNLHSNYWVARYLGARRLLL